MLREGGGDQAWGFLLKFPEKFLERRVPRGAGGWEAWGSRLLREGKSKAHRHRSVPSQPATAKAKLKPTETLTAGEKRGDPSTSSFLCLYSAPGLRNTREKGEGKGAMMESLKCSLDVCVVE